MNMAYTKEVENALQNLNDAIASNPKRNHFDLMKVVVEVVAKHKGLKVGLDQAEVFSIVEKLKKDQYLDLKLLAFLGANSFDENDSNHLNSSNPQSFDESLETIKCMGLKHLDENDLKLLSFLGANYYGPKNDLEDA